MPNASSSDKLRDGFPTPGPQKPTGQHVMDHVFFLSHAGWKAARETNAYDYVIIGSGFCALAFADRMLEKRKKSRILILERGSFFLPEHFQNLPLPYKKTLGGLSETFPWTLSAKTAQRQDGHIRWQHGMVPFFGGRSTLWSSWCPCPTQEEMEGWPKETIEAAKKNFDDAKRLLRVTPADKIDEQKDVSQKRLLAGKRPVYGELQKCIQKRLEVSKITEKVKHNHIYRSEPAPLAGAAEGVNRTDFQKFSTPGELLSLRDKGEGHIEIANECVVERIIEQDGKATALQTSRGVLALGDAKLILAMGTLPPTTLVRNSFPKATKVGERFSAHFITAIVARVPLTEFDPQGNSFGELEIGACYVAGHGPEGYTQQYHIQLSALHDKNPEQNASTALRYMPDVVATASEAQLRSSKDHVVFVCAVLGELDSDNKENWFRRNAQDDDPTTNSLLQVIENKRDMQTWEAMDNDTFDILEKVLSHDNIEYWHDSNGGEWLKARPPCEQRRVPALVHESSTLYLGSENDAPVRLDYRLRAAANVYVTGAGLWPRGGAWNPTLTMVALAQDLADELAGS